MVSTTTEITDAELAKIRATPEGRRHLDTLRDWLAAGEHRKALEARQRALVEERADVQARQAEQAAEAARLDRALAEIRQEIGGAVEQESELRRQLDTLGAKTAGA